MMILAGTPTAVALSGTSQRTTAPAPIFAPLWITIFPSNTALAPIETSSSMIGTPPPERSNSNMLIELTVLSNHGLLGDDASHTVVLEQATIAYLGLASDMASKEKLRQMSENSRQRTDELRAFGAGVGSFIEFEAFIHVANLPAHPQSARSHAHLRRGSKHGSSPHTRPDR